MARATTPTLLSLDRFAEVMGIAGPHFAGASAGDFFPAGGRCNDLWFQHQWQAHDRVSREDLARTIAIAEMEIASVMGFWPAPKYISQEQHMYPHYYRPEQLSKPGSTNFRRGFPNYTFNSATGANNRPKGIKLDWGKFIQAGQRALASVGTATTAAGTLAYSDEDGDGFDETVTIALTTSLTDECEIKVFYADETDPEYEIRPARSAVISGGTVTLTFWVWQFVDPDLWEFFPTADGNTPIDLTDTGNLLTSVDVYREYVDETSVSAQFYWEPDASCTCCGGTGCPDCVLDTQTGCIHQRGSTNFVVPKPATYNEDTEVWDTSEFDQCIEPDLVKVWYYAGSYSNRWLSGRTCNPMEPMFEMAIAFLTIARLERPFCACENLEALADRMREDLATSDRNMSRFVTDDIQESARVFGTMRGEVMAWRQIKNIVRKVPRMALVN